MQAMTRLVLIAILLVGLAVPAWAGSDEGVAAYERGDYETAFREFLPLAEQGDAIAQIYLGGMYDLGKGVPQDDAEALKWFRKAADTAVGQRIIGDIYSSRRGSGPPDYAEAIGRFADWADDRAGLRAYQRGDYATAIRKWKPLAEQGHADAQVGLGFMAYFGDRRSFDPDAIPLDDADAAKWFRLAAEQGQADAQAYLGLMYNNGEVVTQDYVQAYKWFTLAVANSDSKEFDEGVQAVLQSRNELEAQMTPDQIAEAQRLVREWMARHQKGGSE